MRKTDFLGMKLKNPLIIAAGPWNRDGRSLHDSIAAGAGAVVTESIVSDTMIDVGPRIACDGSGSWRSPKRTVASLSPAFQPIPLQR